MSDRGDVVFRTLTFVAVGFALSGLARALGMQGYDFWAFLVSGGWVMGVLVGGALEVRR